MRLSTSIKFPLFIALVLSFIACDKDEPYLIEKDIPLPGGGVVTGVFINNDQSTSDTFLISEVSGRYTSLGGFSFSTSNDNLQLLFFFPDVNDTGRYSYTIGNNLRIIDGDDTIPTYTHFFNVDITHFDQFSNHNLVSGTFEVIASTLGPNEYYVEVQNGQFSNIPISDMPSNGNNVIYQGEEIGLTNSKSLIMDHIYFSKFNFADEFIYTTSFGLNDFDNANSTMSFDRMNSQIILSHQNPTENLVSGRIRTTSKVDLDLNFEGVSYMKFPELEDGQMAMVFNFGEVTMYFDSAKYFIKELPFEYRYIEAYANGEVSISMTVPSDIQGNYSDKGHSNLSNDGLTFLPAEVDVYGFIDLSSDHTIVSCEFGSMITSMPYNQVSIKGRNILVEK